MDSIKDTLSSVTSSVTAATASIVGTADTSTPTSPVAAQTSDPLNPSEQPPDGSMDRQAVDQQSVPGSGIADRAAQGWASVKDSVGSMIGGAGSAGGAGGDGRAKDAVEQVQHAVLGGTEGKDASTKQAHDEQVADFLRDKYKSTGAGDAASQNK